VTQEWQPAGNLELQQETDTALLTLIEPGQTVTLYVTAQLVPEQMNPLTHTVTVTGTNPMDEQHPLAVSEKLELPIQPLTVEFSVQKKADRQMAAAGDTVNYQICIRNTGERTLHSVVTTERFQNEGIQAFFQEQEGITLNENHDKAMISQILPGEAVSLSASVVIPESAAGQELINQVTVLTQETGEKTVTAQSAVQVEEKIQMTQTPIPTQTPQATPEPTATPTAEPTATPAPTAAAAQVQSNTDSYNAPKTGDNSPIEFYLVLSIVSFVLLYPLLILIRAKRNH
jgi:uncharacterized surface anchored protein